MSFIKHEQQLRTQEQQNSIAKILEKVDKESSRSTKCGIVDLMKEKISQSGITRKWASRELSQLNNFKSFDGIHPFHSNWVVPLRVGTVGN
jgi:hypothetical protein